MSCHDHESLFLWANLKSFKLSVSGSNLCDSNGVAPTYLRVWFLAPQLVLTLVSAVMLNGVLGGVTIVMSTSHEPIRYDPWLKCTGISTKNLAMES